MFFIKIVLLTFINLEASIFFIMKKAFKISPLEGFLIILVLFSTSFLDIISMKPKLAFSSSFISNKKIFPLKRPLNLFRTQESVDTILNMIHKEGGKAVGDLKSTTLQKKETLYDVLKRIKFDNNNISNITLSIQKLPNARKILSSLPIGMTINYSTPSNLIGGALKLSFNKTKDIFVWQGINNDYNSIIALRPTRFEKSYVKGTIKSSLYKSAVKAGIPENTLFEMVRLLGFSVDFQRDIRTGDTFEVFFTKQIDLLENSVINTKPIKFVSINLSGKKLNFFEYKDRYGFSKYFDENGKSSKRTIMKTPINGARLSSGYGNRRHPVLGYTKMHRGLDFAAPAGTPIFAAGDGIIEKAGWNGSYGRYIRIRHVGAYKTAYAHLSGIHKRIRTGRRVSQGKIIGYVGSSGRSTGAHLHYEVILNNRQINPMNIKLPSGKNISKSNLKDFKNKINKIIQEKIAFKNADKNRSFAENAIREGIILNQTN